MRYRALVCDYDGTIATDGTVGQTCLTALRRLKDAGCFLIMVTGRQLHDLARVFPYTGQYSGIFDRIIAENGAVLYLPETGEETLLCTPPSAEFIRSFQEHEVPVSVGRVVIATEAVYRTVVLRIIGEERMSCEVIGNKGSLMVLPPGVSKATGLRAALDTLHLPFHAVVGIGDAENDEDFLNLCGCSAAVDNALPSVKSRVAVVTSGSDGNGVAELVGRLLMSGLRSCT